MDPPPKATTGTPPKAEPPLPPIAEGVPGRYRFYGWHLAISLSLADVFVGVGAVLAAAGVKKEEQFTASLIGAIGFRIMPVMVNGLEGGTGKAIGSGALELLGPITGLVIASKLAAPCGPEPTDDCTRARRLTQMAGTALGAVAAATIDIAALGWTSKRTNPFRETPKVGLAPLVLEGGGGLSVGGTF